MCWITSYLKKPVFFEQISLDGTGPQSSKMNNFHSFQRILWFMLSHSFALTLVHQHQQMTFKKFRRLDEKCLGLNLGN